MSRRIHRGGIAAAALALALALAPPAHAAGLGGWDPASGLLLRAWHWLAGGWTAPAAGPPGGGGRAAGADPQGGAGVSASAKEGMGIDPNGGHSLGTGSTTGSTPADEGA